jgi:hypothetical protein
MLTCAKACLGADTDSQAKRAAPVLHTGLNDGGR